MTDLLTPLLRAALLVFQCGLIGGTVFAWAVAAKAECQDMLRLAGLAGFAAALASLAGTLVLLSSLMRVIDLPLADALGAEFIRHQMIYALAALLAGTLCRLPRVPPALAVIVAAAVVAASAAGGHAASRIDNHWALLATDFVHQMAAGVWLGGIPFLLLALRNPDGTARIRICRRFSGMAALSVAALAASAGWLAVLQVGAWAGMAGTDFGAMAGTKVLIFGLLLLLGLGNLLAGRHLDQDAPLRRVRTFAVAEIGLGIAVLMVAASLGMQPPPAEVPAQIMAPTDVLGRLIPERWPRFLAAVPLVPGGFEDRAWSEMTHHGAGLVMLIMGLLAFARSLPGLSWARHWPLLFLVIAMAIPLISDPDSWPLGPHGFWGKPGDMEVVEHRLAVLLVAAFGIGEWRVQTGRAHGRAALVFPLACFSGGLLLLTHSHDIADIRITLPIHISHMLLAVLGMAAGVGRWIELAGDPLSRRLAGHLWPLAFALVGVVLLLYRET